MSVKLVINEDSISKIKDFSIKRFHDSAHFRNMDNSDMQSYLIIAGLYDYLKSVGVDPQFEIKKAN